MTPYKEFSHGLRFQVHAAGTHHFVFELNCIHTGRQSMTIKQKHQVALLYCKKMRLQEEEVLLLQEMKNFLVYFKECVISKLEDDIQCK